MIKNPIGTARVLAGGMGTGAFLVHFGRIWVYVGRRFGYISRPRDSSHRCDQLADHFSTILESFRYHIW